MSKFPGVVFDIEADGLEPSKIYVVSASNSESSGVSSRTDYESMRKIKECPVLVGHNIIRFDIPAMERILGIEFPKDTLFIDTLAVSWYLYPLRPKHGLADWGEEFGIPKPEIEDWYNLPLEEYVHRCEEDVKINKRLWEKQWTYLLKLYGTPDAAMDFLRYLQFKMRCAALAEKSGWKLDIDKCRASIQKLEKIQKEKIDELGRVLPQVPIMGVVKPPAKCFKGNGELSEVGKRWRQLLESRGLSISHDSPVEVVRGYEPGNPNSHQQIKQWLFDLGWEPDVFKTNDKGEEVPQINRLKQDGGGPSESVKRLMEVHPEISPIVGLGVLQHRLGILNGFIRDVDADGYLRARIAGLTNTLRFKHAELVNLPKIDAEYGEDIRGALICEDDEELCGSDMSSLEDRLKQHYCFKFDPEYVKTQMVPGFDPHLDLALSAKKITQEHIDQYKSGTYEPWIKTKRGVFKNGNYSCQYGAFPPKIAKTCGITLEEAQEVFDAYWERNWSIKVVAQSCKTKKIDGQQWLYNPISKFWYSLRAEKDKFSTLVQGSGVFCFDTWVGFVLKRRPQLTSQFHDEIVLTVKRGHRDDMKEILEWAISKTNEVLSLNRQLDIDIQFGPNYGAIH